LTQLSSYFIVFFDQKEYTILNIERKQNCLIRKCSAIKDNRQIMITKLRPYRTLVLQCTFVLLSLFVTSCLTTTYVPYPLKDEVALGEKLPIDGTWVNQNNVRFCISRGIMFVDNLIPVNPPLRNGQVVAKNIKQVSSRKYTLDAGSHNKTLGIVGFGRGEIEVVSNSSLVVRTFPNERTQLWQTSESTFQVGKLDDPATFMAQLKAPAALSPTGIQKVSSQERSRMSYLSTSAGVQWALIIGISKYRDSKVPGLRYASADARAFYDWAVSSAGGRIPPSRVKLLLDENATGAAIKDGLFNWLTKALAEDVVTIYFAGHGSPQAPDQTDNLFLLPYDADYSNVATTGFPMWDIETALKRFIKSRKVIVIADACHAGGVGQAFDIAWRMGRGIKVNPISSGLHSLSKVGDGVCVISASDDKQYSQESQKWGGGHGVFTHFLLKGLSGKADFNKDSYVTLGEIIPYLSEQVRRATNNAQCPVVAGRFDPALSIGR
jgi:hypothetical protein